MKTWFWQQQEVSYGKDINEVHGRLFRTKLFNNE
jgi:hypothetical protein